MLYLIFYLPVCYFLINFLTGLLLVTAFKDQISPLLIKYTDSSYLLPVVYLTIFSVLGFFLLGYFFRRFKGVSSRQTFVFLASKPNNGSKFKSLLPYLNLLLIILVFIRDLNNLFDRDVYIWTNMGLLPGLFVLTAPVFVGLQKRGFLAHFNLSFIILYSFALATRASGLVPILFLSTRAAVNNMPPILIRNFYVLLVPFLYLFSLINRNSPRHGLLFYFQELPRSLGDIAGNVGLWLLEFVNNVGTSLIILSGTLEDNSSNKFGFDYFAIVFNPLGGQSVGWDKIFLDYRLHLFIPYSGLGEIINISPVLALVFISFLFYLYGSSLLSYFNTPRGFSKAFSGLAALFTLFAFVLIFQYNARAVMRFVWVAAGLRVFAIVLRASKSKNSKTSI